MNDFWENFKRYGLIVGLIGTLIGWGITIGSSRTKSQHNTEEIAELKEENKALKAELKKDYENLRVNVEELTKGYWKITAWFELDTGDGPE